MIVALPFLLFLNLAGQATVPFKPANEYEVLIDFKFQDRPAPDRYKANFDVGAEEKKRTASGPLPYLKLQIKLLTLGSEELKVKVINSNGNLVYNRKAALDTAIKLDLGFIDDVKDRVTPHEFTVLFLSDSKASISQIHLIVMEDGTFLVNNEVKGKF
jgi:hypothetical protein